MIDEIRLRHRCIAAEVCDREGKLMIENGAYHTPFFKKKTVDLTDKECVAIYAKQLANDDPGSIVDPTVPILNEEQQADYDRIGAEIDSLREQNSAHDRLLKLNRAVEECSGWLSEISKNNLKQQENLSVEQRHELRKQNSAFEQFLQDHGFDEKLGDGLVERVEAWLACVSEKRLSPKDKKRVEAEFKKGKDKLRALRQQKAAIGQYKRLTTEGFNVWCAIREHLDRLYSDELKERAIAFLTSNSTVTQTVTGKRVELIHGGIRIDGEISWLKERHANLMKLLVDAGGDYIALSKQKPKYRSRDIADKSLPQAVKDIIEAKSGAGTRINPEYLS